jgi:hypothetical protein
VKTISITIPHSLGKAEARQRIEQGFGRLRQQMTGGVAGMLSFNERWEQDRLHFEGGALGQKMTGRLDVGDQSLEIQVDLPELLAAIGSRMAERLRSEGQKLLEKR